MIDARTRAGGLVTLFLRLGLGLGFLSAVTDRFGLWGPRGTANVAWGDWSSFVAYTAVLNPFAPSVMVPVLAWAATVAEVVLGLMLVVGWRTRAAAVLSGCLLLLFGAGMTVGTGIKSALNASVLAASAAGFALAMFESYPWSVDRVRRQPDG